MSIIIDGNSGISSAGGTLIKISYLTSGTSFTTQATTTRMLVECVGAGGGGGAVTSGAGGGGGCGAMTHG